jgi:ABC-2 type transport system ATP-binding protein
MVTTPAPSTAVTTTRPAGSLDAGSDAVVVTEGLTKHFGRTLALDDVRLMVPPGIVFGYLGPNGAGKTTTIRLLLGLLRPDAGRASVLGHDAWSERTAAHADIGYLPGDFVAYERLTGEQYLTYLSRLRERAGRGLSRSWARELAARFDLDLTRRWGTLSSGNRQKLGVVQAFMHHPRLLVLDEPTKGLDPLMQREFLDLVRQARAEGQTVFLSSHDLSEVEQVADRVAMLRHGRLVVVEDVAALKAHAVRRLDLTFELAVPQDEIRRASGVCELTVDGSLAHVAVEGSMACLIRTAAAHGLVDVVTHQADLEEIFLTYYADDAGPARGSG